MSDTFPAGIVPVRCAAAPIVSASSTDDHGDGMWVCNQCQPKPRPAMDLVTAFTGKPFREAARAVDEIIGNAEPCPSPQRSAPERVARVDDGKPSAYAARLWRDGIPVQPGDPVDQYLRYRGVSLDVYPACLRSTTAWHQDFETNINTKHPTMLAQITGVGGKPVAVHRTFLADDSSGKAAVSTPRKVASPYGRGPTIRLTQPAPVMGIAEGIETALAAARLFAVPTWSVICAHGIETFEPPQECEKLIVFADHDHHGVGKRAAEAPCRLQIATEIRMPDKPGADWNDVLLEQAR